MTLDKKVITDNLEAKTRASFFILLQNAAELSVLEGTSPSVFDEERRTVIKQAAALDIVMDNEAHTALQQSLHALREKLLASFSRLNALKSYLSITEAWLWREHSMGQSVGVADVPEDGNQLFLRHLDMLLGDKDEQGKYEADENLMRVFMSVIPLRMTSARYRDYIEAAFHIMEYELEVADTEDYQRLFCPMDALAEAGCLDNMKQTLDSLWESEPAALSEDEMTEARAHIEHFRIELLQGINAVCTLFDVVNALLIVRHGGSSPAVLNEPEARALYDCYQSGTTDADFHDRLDDAVNEALEDIPHNPLEGEDIQNEADIPEDIRRLYGDWKQVAMLFYESGLDYLETPRLRNILDEDEPASTASFLDAFLPYIERRAAELPPKRRRFLRQHFLQYLPYPYDFEKYKQYFLDTYGSLDDAGRVLMTLYVAGMGDNESGEPDADRNI